MMSQVLDWLSDNPLVWLAWIVPGGIGYFVCECLYGDSLEEHDSPMAPVGACILGPLMFVIAWGLWRAKRYQNEQKQETPKL